MLVLLTSTVIELSIMNHSTLLIWIHIYVVCENVNDQDKERFKFLVVWILFGSQIKWMNIVHTDFVCMF